MTPVRLFEHLINEQYLSAAFDKFSGEIGNTAPLKIEVIHVDVQTLPVILAEFLLGVLQQEQCFAHSARSFDANHLVVPIYFVHQFATHEIRFMLNQISMSTIKSFHQRVCHVLK